METFTQSNNKTIKLIYCWSPNESDLLSNHTFMISRQILRVIIYYIMPLLFVSVFYILIAKHLFQTKGFILTPVSTQPFINEVTNSKRGQTNNKSPKQSSNNSIQENLPARLMLLDNEKLMNKRESLPAVLPSTSSSSSLTNNIRRSRDHVYGNLMTNNNNMVIHTLYQDVKTRKQLRARHKVAKTVLFLCSVFFICWLPKQIHDLYW
jgi:hypothetical protein